eukprot:TRINITY_DN8440_c0_g1_i1.p1 TRINITY_DN8440_c0_g1~~TRINITY_DN8440_c0_g1_i1.p1  ORF type:complete len:344 (-),score=56.10 TRINITY_DN8440_c0_g1_i1:196-1227(-)
MAFSQWNRSSASWLCCHLHRNMMILTLLFTATLKVAWAESGIPFEVEVQDPPIFSFPKFLTDAECNHLIAIGKDKVKPAQILTADGKAAFDPQRTSQSYFLSMRSHGDDRIVQGIRDKMRQALQQMTRRFPGLAPAIVDEYREDLQVQRYGPGELYGAHFDFTTKGGPGTDGYQRSATFLMYLTDVHEGGETVFPSLFKHGDTYRFSSATKCSNVICDQASLDLNQQTPYCCCGDIFRIKPKRGMGAVFYPAHINKTKDARLWHASCPVVGTEITGLSGGDVKWISQQWYHTEPPPERNRDVDSAHSRAGRPSATKDKKGAKKGKIKRQARGRGRKRKYKAEL